MGKYKRMLDVFDIVDNTIFGHMSNSVPWYGIVTAANLDFLYLHSNSGDRIISPFVRRNLNSSGEISDISKISTALEVLFIEKWSKIWDVLQLSYDPLENYSMTETGLDTTNHTGTDENLKTGSLDRSGSIVKSGNETLDTTTTYSGSETDTGTQSDNNSTTTNNRYAYNSNSAVPTDSTTENNNFKNTKTFSNRTDDVDNTHTYNNVTDTDTRKDTYNNIKDKRTANLTDQTSHNFSRSGNIGVTTTQQMLESEINIRQYTFFMNVFKDIDSILCLSIY